MEYTLLIILWCAWCTIHSGMISLTVTNYLKDRLGNKYRFYRLFYNLIALSTLIPLMYYNAGIKGQVLFRWDGIWLIFQLILAITVLILIISGAMKYDMLQLLGIRQVMSGKSSSALSETGEIDTSGVLSVTRHPWYLAVIILVWIRYRDMYVSTLIVNIILTVYMVVGTVLEERKLVAEFGGSYRAYQEKVSMLFPFKCIRSKLLPANKS